MKLNNDYISRSLRYYHDRLKPKRTTQIVYDLARPYEDRGIQVMDIRPYVRSYTMEDGG